MKHYVIKFINYLHFSIFACCAPNKIDQIFQVDHLCIKMLY